MSSGITKWRDYIPEAKHTCHPQFKLLLAEKGLVEIDSEDIFERICLRYVNWAKLIHHKVTRWFESLWGLHGVAPQFSKKDAKWLLPIIVRRTSNKDNPELCLESMEELLLWCALRYNFWLAQQLI
jgi:hypothetical protein